ncbi:MAG: DUF4974 domain-containing protein [Bacteroidota bacterium]
MSGSVPHLPLLLVLMLMTLGVKAQETMVSMDYKNATLEEVITDLESRYSLHFSYSRDLLPMDLELSAYIRNVSLSEALETLFDGSGVEYALIGGQVVLRYNAAGASPPLSQNKEGGPIKKKPKKVQPPPPEPEPVLVEVEPELDSTLLVKTEILSPVKELEEIPQKKDNRRFAAYDFEEEEVPGLHRDSMNVGRSNEERVAQFSLFPMIGTNGFRSRELTNNLSVNVFWGVSGGVRGLEVSGFGSRVNGHVTGVQFAGFSNVLKGDLRGYQVGGFVNAVGGRAQGAQAAGFFNIADRGQVVQFSGLGNVVKHEFKGVQFAGVFNVAGENTRGAYQFSGLWNVNKGESALQISSLWNLSRGARIGQTSGFFNVSRNGSTGYQIAGLFNVAQDVNAVQVSGLINVARDVKGVQIGLINFADTVGGVTIGLLNFVRHGYNRLELSTSETFQGQFALKLGSGRFYNVLQSGFRWETAFRGRPQQWLMGYGLGTQIKWGKHWASNIELIGSQVSETLNEFTTDLNLLTQARFLLEFRFGKRWGVFGGVTYNGLFSRRFNPDTGLTGSDFVPERAQRQMVDARTSLDTWFGFQAGVRF